jgi:putative endonuclease
MTSARLSVDPLGAGTGDVAHARRTAGAVAFRAGQAAELSVARVYDRRGWAVAVQRWRGRAGEIDLIARDGEGYVFVEVKKARDFEEAALRLGRRQMDRIIAAACEFLGTQPGGMLAAMRFDLALVDSQGQVRIIENAFGEA